MSEIFDCQFIPGENMTNHAELMLNEFPQQKIEKLLWSTDGYFPQVAFSMAYTSQSILLKYFVKEKYAIAKHTKVNDLVYKDSCVEFFVSFDNRNYYNLEFNCIGTPYGAYGKDKQNRTLLPAAVLTQIQIAAQMKVADSEGFTQWEITLDMPFGTFVYDDIRSLKGVECKANFYKCGDESPQPHYLSWSNILSSEPNFHLPEFFGTVRFI